MIERINKVKEWQKTTGSPVLNKPGIPNAKRCDLRIKLLAEELDELEVALAKHDLTEALDALCDLQYILFGTVLELGLQDVFEKSFDEVHNSNMSKFTKTTKEAQESCFAYADKEVEAYYKKVGDLHVIMRSDDDKILKGINFFKPRLKAIIEKHLKESK